MKKKCVFLLIVGLISCKQSQNHNVGSSKNESKLVQLIDSSKTNLTSKLPNCRINSLKRIGGNEISTKFGRGMEHFLLIKDFPKTCLDSNLLMEAALNYKDTVKLPTNVLRFYYSDKDFIVNGDVKSSRKINRSCLVAIIFTYGEPNQYLFYNDKGDVVYQGANWKK